MRLTKKKTYPETKEILRSKSAQKAAMDGSIEPKISTAFGWNR